MARLFEVDPITGRLPEEEREGLTQIHMMDPRWKSSPLEVVSF